MFLTLEGDLNQIKNKGCDMFNKESMKAKMLEKLLEFFMEMPENEESQGDLKAVAVSGKLGEEKPEGEELEMGPVDSMTEEMSEEDQEGKKKLKAMKGL